jgi:hypothetical protein
MPILLTEWCNIFGDDINGAKIILGGISSSKVTQQWYCPTVSVGRFYMVCEHGHKGQVMKLCQKHHDEFDGKVTFCPRCNNTPPGHNCNLRLVPKS